MIVPSITDFVKKSNRDETGEESLEELEIIDEYNIAGVNRFVLRHRKTKLLLNIAAKNKEEAIKKSKDILKMLIGNNNV